MASVDVSQNTSDINFSVSAADKVAELIKEEDNSDLNLRVSITGGGCSGFQYGFSFDEQINDDDTVIIQQCSDGKSSVKLLIDSMSYQYLHDAEIDYIKGIQGEQFVIRNPNAKTTCGCGSSFSIGDEDDL
ncbi:TPA: iron-sulfur cluster insertion protein ErpA [Legionella pneumophila subsp. pneumophila]|uniref:Iron-sulfur cluster insertion protein ErpA n=1 Tax=Legionella pneumophila (strain Lens) TaxID=297245 RepID=ERPA_LEGPL|nr:iron-sulfur cluster insertion protein ErpA [Legionella pneumophila]Q5WWW0.1 RecName: Full=Iron-sulfur cluster insertion protein ErpA [Legionella pneumophila str. Lens]AOW52067.1 iron-sulfur cluster insertion protein ErpA [Legionella pneumophila subsp. pneumophila]AOW54342.1 iron-sulfur cluster insertion protein ErpA [Legionella pneumophila subsp. pneumophila]AOW57363.1 iron-sulfur cluster insertion protein ErpA [Legionella pneumophila subsp. pneumophila]AOW59711.1 iron-sulfur cluster insert